MNVFIVVMENYIFLERGRSRLSKKRYNFPWVPRRHSCSCNQNIPYFPSTLVPFSLIRNQFDQCIPGPILTPQAKHCFANYSWVICSVAVSCGYSRCLAVSACDGLCHLTKIMDQVETPFGFQPIVWAFARHTVGRCLIFPTLLQFLPTGQHGLCFGCCFSGLLPLCSLKDGPPIGIRFRESLVISLYSEIDHLHHSMEAQCDTILLPLGDCHSFDLFRKKKKQENNY